MTEQEPRRKRRTQSIHNSFESWRRVQEITPEMDIREAYERILANEIQFTRANESENLRLERNKQLKEAGLKQSQWHLLHQAYTLQPLVEDDKFENIIDKNRDLIKSSLPAGFELHFMPHLMGVKGIISENPEYMDVYVKASLPKSSEIQTQ